MSANDGVDSRIAFDVGVGIRFTRRSDKKARHDAGLFVGDLAGSNYLPPIAPNL